MYRFFCINICKLSFPEERIKNVVNTEETGRNCFDVWTPHIDSHRTSVVQKCQSSSQGFFILFMSSPMSNVKIYWMSTSINFLPFYMTTLTKDSICNIHLNIKIHLYALCCKSLHKVLSCVARKWENYENFSLSDLSHRSPPLQSPGWGE